MKNARMIVLTDYGPVETCEHVMSILGLQIPGLSWTFNGAENEERKETEFSSQFFLPIRP